MRVLISSLLLMTIVVGVKANINDDKLWYDLEDTECAKNLQSPIELNSFTSVLHYGISPIKFHNFDLSFDGILTNNGHTVELKNSKANASSISGGSFKDVYFTVAAHFHWGSKDHHGSEHVINGRRSSLEMHLVHRNRQYETTEKAIRHDDGLVVIAISFNVKPSKTTDFAPLSKLTNKFDNIKASNTSTVVPNISWCQFFSELDTEYHFLYKGSLTTPPCSEVVSWIVFPNPIEISANQMSLFHILLDRNGHAMKNNYRNVQPTNRRTVWRIFDNMDGYGNCNCANNIEENIKNNDCSNNRNYHNKQRSYWQPQY